MKQIAIITAVVFLISGIAMAQDEAKELTGADDLVKQKSQQWGEVWVHPDADISRYHKLYLWQSVFQFRDLGDEQTNRTTTAMLKGDQGPFAMDEESKSKFETIVSEVVAKELTRTKQFEIVDAIGPGTLAIRGAILDIVSNVPPNVGRQANVHLANVGEATFIFELVDAETGVIQARVGDRRVIQPPSRMNQVSQVPTNSATVWNDVEMWASDQAMTLRKALDKAAKKAGE